MCCVVYDGVMYVLCVCVLCMMGSGRRFFDWPPIHLQSDPKGPRPNVLAIRPPWVLIEESYPPKPVPTFSRLKHTPGVKVGLCPEIATRVVCDHRTQPHTHTTATRYCPIITVPTGQHTYLRLPEPDTP